MAKPSRVSISASLPAERDTVTPSQPDPIVTSSRQNAKTSRSHASLYVSRHVLKALREIAVAQDCKAHDLMIEGLRRVMREYGRDFDELNNRS